MFVGFTQPSWLWFGVVGLIAHGAYQSVDKMPYSKVKFLGGKCGEITVFTVQETATGRKKPAGERNRPVCERKGPRIPESSLGGG